LLGELALQAREAGEPLPDLFDLAALRSWFLALIPLDEAGRYLGLLDLGDEELQKVAALLADHDAT
jgi:hypothetical protein